VRADLQGQPQLDEFLHAASIHDMFRYRV
jgi:hypothetical protein